MISEARVTTSKSPSNQSSVDQAVAKVKAGINKREAEKTKRKAQRKPSGAAADPSTYFKKKPKFTGLPLKSKDRNVSKDIDQSSVDRRKEKLDDKIKDKTQNLKKAVGQTKTVVGKVIKGTTGGMSKMYSSNRSLSSHYDWRDDLGFIDEIAAGPDKKDNEKIDPKNVKNKITINPDVKTEAKVDQGKDDAAKQNERNQRTFGNRRNSKGGMTHTDDTEARRYNTEKGRGVKIRGKKDKTPVNYHKKDSDKRVDALLKGMKEAKDNDPCWDTHKQVGMKKKGGKMVPNCVPKEEMSNEDFYRKKFDIKDGGYKKTTKMDKSNKRSGDSKAQYRELHKDLAKEQIKKDEYGDPIGGPKLSKKEKKKNLSTYEGDKMTEGTWLKEYTEKKMERTMRDKIHPNTLVGTGGYKKNVQKMTPQEEMSAEFGDGRIKVFDLLKPAPMRGMADIFATEESNPRIPRKKGQPANSKKHSDLYTDENPKGTIHGLGFKDVDTAKASVSKIRNSSRSHAHKIQAAVAMEQRAREMGKTSEAAVYRKFINSMKKKDMAEMFKIDPEKHKKAQKTAKMINLARGNKNPNEKAAALKKAKQPKMMGEKMMDKIVSDYLSELNRYEKEKGIDTKTNKKIEKGGTAKNNLALQSVMKKYGSQRMGANQPKKVKGAKSTVGTGKMTQMMMKKKDQAASSKAFADRAKKAGYKSTQDYANVVSRYGSEKNMKQGRGLGS